MLRVFFSRRWLGWHLLLLAGVAVLILLGRWQWDRAQSTVGTLQNLGYAFEWWLFACLAVYGWWREMRADVRAGQAAERGEPASSDRRIAVSTTGLGRTATPDGAGGSAADRGGGTEEIDDEVAAYNAYLTRLNRRHVRQRH